MPISLLDTSKNFIKIAYNGADENRLKEQTSDGLVMQKWCYKWQWLMPQPFLAATLLWHWKLQAGDYD